MLWSLFVFILGVLTGYYLSEIIHGVWDTFLDSEILGKMGILHSNCPGKHNIYPPAFRKGEQFHNSKGKLLCTMWECTGCKTLIYVDEDHDEARESSTS